jgi:hypothetical protein
VSNVEFCEDELARCGLSMQITCKNNKDMCALYVSTNALQSCLLQSQNPQSIAKWKKLYKALQEY